MKAQTLYLEPLGTEVSYYRHGRGEPLLFLHGIIAMQGWEPVLDKLATSFDVIAPYVPGWGPSRDADVLEGPLDIALFCRDVLDAFGLTSSHVFGVSIGAWMAAELAAIYPGRVRRLVLCNPLGLWIEEIPGEDAFAQHPLKPTAVLFADPAQRELLLVRDEDKTESYIQELNDLKAAAKFLWPIPDTGVHKRLSRISAPTLVVVSEKDAIVPPLYGLHWQRAIAGAKLETLGAAGHLATLECPETCARVVTDFLLPGHQ